MPQQDDGFERTTLVFLHEGLGCIEMWRDFPQSLCNATRCKGIVYDRTGYGGSSPWPSNPGVHYMEIEADEVLPRLFEVLGVEDCVPFARCLSAQQLAHEIRVFSKGFQQWLKTH